MISRAKAAYSKVLGGLEADEVADSALNDTLPFLFFLCFLSVDSGCSAASAMGPSPSPLAVTDSAIFSLAPFVLAALALARFGLSGLEMTGR